MLKHILSALSGGPVTEASPKINDPQLADLVARLDGVSRARLGRSLAIREVDAGSCNGCELEIHALNNPIYDIERFGIRFVASPRHADVLLVTGPVSKNMHEALLRSWDATPEPKWLVACGDCAVTGGLFKDGYANIGPVDAVLPVDLRIPGCPPKPVDLLSGLLTLLEASDGARLKSAS